MSSLVRPGLFALVFVTGCAQVESTGLLNTSGQDASTAPDFSQSSNLDQNDTPDFATPSDDLATSTSTDMASGVQVCNVSKIRINEVATQGSGGAGDEFIELYNPCMATVTMTGATIVYRSAAGTSDTPALWTFTNETIATHGFFVVGNTSFSGTANAKPFKYGATGALANTAGGVGLRDSSNNLVDSMGWGNATNAFVEGTPVGAPSATQSAARTVDGVDTNNNLADFSLGTPTPGASN